MNLLRYGQLATTSPAFVVESTSHAAMPQLDLNCAGEPETSIVCASFSFVKILSTVPPHNKT
jgi:hypothetical protein